MLRRLLWLILGSLVFLQGLGLAQSPPLIILTNGKLGFQEGTSSYGLDMPALKFEALFGPPELKSKNDSNFGYVGNSISWTYVNDGLTLLLNRNGTIRCITFNLVGTKKLQAANAKTDRGIGRHSALRAVLKAYGDPYRHQTLKQGGYDDLTLYYKYGDKFLSFDFDHGVLTQVSLQADFLRWIDLVTTP